jgi:hypothetical protein
MIVNFRARGISQGVRKLTQAPRVIYIKKKEWLSVPAHCPYLISISHDVYIFSCSAYIFSNFGVNGTSSSFFLLEISIQK